MTNFILNLRKIKGGNMDKKSIIIIFFIFTRLLFAQETIITPSQVYTDFENNSVRASDNYNKLQGGNIIIKGTILFISTELFQNNKYAILLYDNDENKKIKVSFSTTNKDLIMKLNKGEKFSISGFLTNFATLNCFEFGIRPENINGTSLEKTNKYEKSDFGYTDYEFSYAEYKMGSVSFEDTHNNKVIKITGKIERMGNGITNNLGVIVFTGYTGSEFKKNEKGLPIVTTFKKIECNFPYEFTSKDMKSAGTKITIVGKYKTKSTFLENVWGGSFALELHDCTFSNEEVTENSNLENDENNVKQEETIERNKLTFIDSRDNEVYEYIEIGNKQWMIENFRYYCNGSYCFNSNSNNCKDYGRLYTYIAAKDNAPAGWRLPTKEEWQELIEKFGGAKIAGKYLLYNGSSGFNAQLGGDMKVDGSFERLNQYGFYWSSNISKTLIGENHAYYIFFSSKSNEVGNNHTKQSSGLSVRYIKDK